MYTCIHLDFLKSLCDVSSEGVLPFRTRKHKIALPIIEMQEEAKSMYFSFMDERNQSLYKVEKTWNKIEERNKYFWTTFLPKDTVYALYEGTGPNN